LRRLNEPYAPRVGSSPERIRLRLHHKGIHRRGEAGSGRGRPNDSLSGFEGPGPLRDSAQRGGSGSPSLRLRLPEVSAGVRLREEILEGVVHLAELANLDPARLQITDERRHSFRPRELAQEVVTLP